MNDIQNLLRKLPAVDRVLGAGPLAELADSYPRALLLEGVQTRIDELRREILRDPESALHLDLSADSVAAEAASWIRSRRPSLRRVLNATGTIIHTNLGRAPLSRAALDAVRDVGESYSNLEFDLQTGVRGHRYSHIEEILCRLTGAEAATVVNNNAGAVLLSLAALARDREVIVSRGELVEIGGAFRIPDVMAAGGCLLREVGTTNKTHLRDYLDAVTENTALLLKVHTSNYRIVGFTAEVSARELVEIGRQKGIPVMEDLGSGMMSDLSAFGLPREPTVAMAVEAGVDVITFSGDKLLGGPQGGLIVGRKWALDLIRKHPLARALRADKMTLAGLEVTLRHYLDPEEAVREIPVLRMMAVPPTELEKSCRKLERTISEKLGSALAEVETVPESSRVGGGALPLTELPGYAVALGPRSLSVDDLAARLRRGDPPLVGRIHEGRLLLNPRTLNEEEKALLPDLLASALFEETSRHE